MEVDKAVSILDSLAGGNPLDSFQHDDVLGAFSLAANALRGKARQPAAAGARWTDEEDACLGREFDAGMTVGEIATQHGRTRGAITSRLVRLGKIDAGTVKVRER